MIAEKKVFHAEDILELWGGVECTVNRVGDNYFSQLERNRHPERLSDLDLFAELGITAIRYPILWENVAPNGLETADWSWADKSLIKLRELAITPIAGLVHHGSGPKNTSLIDPRFPQHLEAYSSAVAQRYPWIEYYTPVNEPLTTARFSGLYGVWYPHGRDEKTFKDAFLTQCRGIVLAMRAIRKINPQAKLIQTDDLGKTYSTPLLEYQAKFNNELRWLTWDILCGRLDESHPLWFWLIDCCFATKEELLWFADNPCIPNFIGANYYVTSERFLDENLQNYPAHYYGGNHVHAYADVEVARSLQATISLKPLLHEMWDRYHIPIVVTEAHIDSTRDDQIRWIAEIWNSAIEAKKEGIDIKAVTVWALLGSYDWNCLVTECRGYYEPGAFDIRGPSPRPTAIASLMKNLTKNNLLSHPVLSGPGWWKRSNRFSCVPVTLPHLGQEIFSLPKDTPNQATILITGATGTLGYAFAKLCEERGLSYRLLNRQEMDIADAGSIEGIIAQYEPWAIINAAGYVRVDDAEKEAERCYRENVIGAATLASICAKRNIALVTFSSDLVFDGQQSAPYIESDSVAPLNVYGRSKAKAETLVLDCHPDSLVIRTSAFFGPWDKYNYISIALRALREKRSFAAANDLMVSPTYVPDLVNTTLDLLIDRESGIWHLSNDGAITWADLALHAARFAKIDASSLYPCPANELAFVASRPKYSVLGSQRSFLMPSLDDALMRYLNHHEVKNSFHN